MADPGGRPRLDNDIRCFGMVDLHQQLIDWLLQGDVAIQYQTRRDLLDDEQPKLRARITTEGWGKRYLEGRNEAGIWGRGFYQPKWTSSHYTLLDLKSLGIAPDQPGIRSIIGKFAAEMKAADGGIYPIGRPGVSDVCVNGMFLNYASYFGLGEDHLRSIVDFLLDQRMDDGGFNCQKNRTGARHSSLHSTLSVLEGIMEYHRSGYTYRVKDFLNAATTSREFILIHRLFRSDRTGQIIHRDLLRLPYPPRWKYNILRALDCFQAAKTPWDDRMGDAIAFLKSKRRRDGRWPLQSSHPGAVHFLMEEPGKPSRWNTMMALRVLRAYGASA